MTESIGPRLKQLREANGLSQSGLAIKLGVASNTISRWERGQQEPPLRLAVRLAEALGCTIYGLLEPANSAKKKS